MRSENIYMFWAPKNGQCPKKWAFLIALLVPDLTEKTKVPLCPVVRQSRNLSESEVIFQSNGPPASQASAPGGEKDLERFEITELTPYYSEDKEKFHI